jgi:hypothetical protein
MALSVEMMIFHKHLDVVRSAFLVAVSPGIRCGRPQRSGCWMVGVGCSSACVRSAAAMAAASVLDIPGTLQWWGGGLYCVTDSPVSRG